VNVAPYSYFNAMCHNPMTVCIGINYPAGRLPDGKKDTLRNIEATGEFVVRSISMGWWSMVSPTELVEFCCQDLTRHTKLRVSCGCCQATA
jgi:flavin reductase (DIM6/NTAB) family NADH-FMN oxidoreductase RutF